MTSELTRAWRWVWGLALLATAVAAFYAEEDWRGSRARAQAAEALRSRLMEIAPAVPPMSAEMDLFHDPWLRAYLHWDPQDRSAGAPPADAVPIRRLYDEATKPGSADTPEAAMRLLAAAEPVEPRLTTLRAAASQRPMAVFPDTFPGSPRTDQTFSPGNLLRIAQLISRLAKADIVAGRPSESYANLQVVMRIADARSTPGTLVERLIDVACAGMVSADIKAGLDRHAWSPVQLADFRRFLSRHDSATTVAAGIELEFSRVGAVQITDVWRWPRRHGEWDWRMLLPHGWSYAWQADLMQTARRMIDASDANSPAKLDRAQAILVSHEKPKWRLLPLMEQSVSNGVITMIPRTQQATAKIASVEKEVEAEQRRG